MLGLQAEQNYNNFKGFVRAAKTEAGVTDEEAIANGGWRNVFERAKHEF